MPRAAAVVPFVLASTLLLACAGSQHAYAPPDYGYRQGGPPPSAPMAEPTSTAGLVAPREARDGWGIDLDDGQVGQDEVGSYAKTATADKERFRGSREPGPKPGGVEKREPDTRGLDRPLVVYLGYLKLRVKRLLEAVDAITRLTEEAGGYIESLSSQAVVVRVPAHDFDAAMARYAALGDVLDRRVKALDVSAQFTDLRARLAVAKESRERLLKLLEQVQDVQERLRILQEVKRLTEQIESIESTLSTLQNLLDYFTITIELEPVVTTGVAVTHRSPFPWVRALAAHRGTIDDGKRAVRLTLPKGFVLFDEEDVYRAQAADTTTLRVGRVRNEPRGGAGFWADAVLHEMDGRDEELVEDGTAGVVTYRVFRNKDVQPRTYLVGVHARGDDLWVVEIFYPNEAAVERHHQAVVAALATFGVK
jgi:hypothetical protein